MNQMAARPAASLAVAPVIPATAVQPPCSYTAHACSRPCMDGYDFCLRHILEDRNAPYRQCSYVYSGSGRRCLHATPRPPTTAAAASAAANAPPERKETGLCAEHARRAQAARQKQGRRRAPPLSAESLLLGLAHYSKAREPTTGAPGGGGAGGDPGAAGDADGEAAGGEGTLDTATLALNPFVDVDASKVNAEASKILDFASDSDSDLDVATFDATFPGPDLDSSDADSMDGGLEDTCKFASFQHARVYTAEEAAQLTKDKLIRLQSLYIDQFRRLQQVLRARRRRYLVALKREKDTLSSIHEQKLATAHELKLYRKLRALNRYQRRCGTEAVLHKRSLERRAQNSEGAPPPRPLPATARCTFTEGGVKCPERSLPVAKHCLKHILLDSHQMLFRPCGCTKAGFTCREPVPVIFEDTTCVFHTALPAPPPHLSASHILEEEVAEAKKLLEESASWSARPLTLPPPPPPPTATTMGPGGDADPLGEADTANASATSQAALLRGEPDRSESMLSETSTTDTASFESSMENVEVAEEA